jgi:hypothetical protein
MEPCRAISHSAPRAVWHPILMAQVIKDLFNEGFIRVEDFASVVKKMTTLILAIWSSKFS